MEVAMADLPLRSARISRRGVLSSLTALPPLPGLLAATAAKAQTAAGVLPSWNDGAAKQAIIEFAHATTTQGSRNFVPPEDRIATFDQDGTLWVEHPLYTQGIFALDRVHALAPQHREWHSREPFRAVLSNNLPALADLSERDWAEIIFVTHAGISQAAFLKIAGEWLATAKHPRFKRLYTELVYQPMIELLNYLRANQFETFIVTGGGQDFVRAYGRRVYGIPTQKVIGSSIATKYEYREGKPELMRLPKLFFNDNFDGKAIGIDLFIGKRPCAAFGNSTDDQQMLEWTGAGAGTRLKMLVYHDDARREYAYGPARGLPDTKVGIFTQACMTRLGARAGPSSACRTIGSAFSLSSNRIWSGSRAVTNEDR
jgi:phosphoglycolate phosphatase-like HAD superfamily hydrolase